VLLSKTPSSGGADLSPELTEVLQNYQKLCDRFKSKCHTLEVHTHTHTHTCTSIFVRTFIDTMKSLAPYPTPTHLN